MYSVVSMYVVVSMYAIVSTNIFFSCVSTAAGVLVLKDLLQMFVLITSVFPQCSPFAGVPVRSNGSMFSCCNHTLFFSSVSAKCRCACVGGVGACQGAGGAYPGGVLGWQLHL